MHRFALSGTSGSAAYSGLMLLAIVGTAYVWFRRTREDQRMPLIYIGALAGAFAGAKIVYILAEGWLRFGSEDVWRQLATGKTILGALIGGYAGVELSKKLVGYPRPTGDLFAVMVPAGLILGRLGCLLYGCCLGMECAPAWYAIEDAAGIARWPAAPVEMLFNLFAIVVLLQLRKLPSLNGQHFHLFLIGYGLFRFAHEFVRETPRILGPLGGYHIAALAVAALGIWRFVARYKQRSTA